MWERLAFIITQDSNKTGIHYINPEKVNLTVPDDIDSKYGLTSAVVECDKRRSRTTARRGRTRAARTSR